MNIFINKLVLVSAFISIAIISVPASAKTVKECNAEYAANKDAIKDSGQKKKDFVEVCRAGAETVPPSTTTTPNSATPTAPAAPQTAPSSPAPLPTPSATPAPRERAPSAATTGSGQYAGDATAKAHCPTDTVVWVNTKSGIYHFAGTHNYGTTKQGTYMCEAEAKAAGDRAAENEKHP